MLRFFDSNLISPLLRIYIYLVLSTLRALFSPFCLQCIDLSNGLDLIPERNMLLYPFIFTQENRSGRPENQPGSGFKGSTVVGTLSENFNHPIRHFQIHPASFHWLFWLLFLVFAELRSFYFSCWQQSCHCWFFWNVLIYMITEDFMLCYSFCRRHM